MMLSAANLTFHETKLPEPPKNWDEMPHFGSDFAPYILQVDWSESEGWCRPIIEQMRNISLHPAAMVLHLAVETMETLKAYRGVDGKIRMFRPIYKLGILNKSAGLAALPTFDAEQLLLCLNKLILANEKWIPPLNKGALYLRPMIFATQGTFQHTRPNQAKLHVPCIVWRPHTSVDGNTMYADAKFTRTWPGSVGETKMGCLYAPTVKLIEVVKAHGCNLMLWLFDEKKEIITEESNMNICFVVRSETGGQKLITPKIPHDLSRTVIYPGVVRDTILRTAAQQFHVEAIEEHEICMHDLRKWFCDGTLLECFGCGTGAGTMPVKGIFDKANEKWIRLPPWDEAQQPMSVASHVSKYFNDIFKGVLSPPDEQWVCLVN